MTTFTLLTLRNFFKINRAETIDEMDKLCKDRKCRMYRVNKKKTYWRTDGWTTESTP